MYHPLKTYNAHKGGLRIAIAGLGGLGTIGLQLALALGNEVSVLSTSENKKVLSLELGAKHFINVNDVNNYKQFNS